MAVRLGQSASGCETGSGRAWVRTRRSPGSADCSTTRSGTWNTGTWPRFRTARTRPPASALAPAAPAAAAGATVVSAAAVPHGVAARSDVRLGKNAYSPRPRVSAAGSGEWPGVGVSGGVGVCAGGGQTAEGGGGWGGGRAARR